MSRIKGRYEERRIHYEKHLKLSPSRRCNICRKWIKEYPEDYNPAYVRYCLDCRTTKLRDECAPVTAKLYL